MVDEAGFEDCKIVASNSLDEFIIRDLIINQKAQIDIFGVGERLITSKSEPVFGGVYKLVAIDDEEGNRIPKIKISENVIKVTNPDFKKVYRLYDKTSGKAIADVLTLRDEEIDDSRDYEIFDPVHTWKRKRICNFEARELQVQIFKKGKCIYKNPSIEEIRDYCKTEIDRLWDEVKRFEYPHKYYVDLSPKLWAVKSNLLNKHSYTSI